MKDLRILFMGTPEFAVHILAHLLDRGHTIIGVVTSPDKPAGRGRKLKASAVKQFADKKELPVYQPKNLKSDDFQKKLKSINPDIGVVVAFRMLPKKVWDFPRLGTFNLHASLLPDYRGAAPINWAIINGESQTGVSTFFLNETIDTGTIIDQKTEKITPRDNAESLHDKLMEKGAQLVDKTLQHIEENDLHLQVQPKNKPVKSAPKLNKANTRIDWTADPGDIYNFIRGLDPYPAAWTILQNGEKKWRCKIFKIRTEKHNHEWPIGKVVKTGKTLKVAVKNGFVEIGEMQLPGKKKMPVKPLLNGLDLKENATMG